MILIIIVLLATSGKGPYKVKAKISLTEEK